MQRLVWTGRTPFEIHEMRVKPDGFELTFTEPVDQASAAAPTSYTLENYTYLYRADYGSPEVDKGNPTIHGITVAKDGLSVRLKTDLVPGHIHELKLPGVRNRSGRRLLHPVGYYTLNTIPSR